jgi:hypothetical protein
LSDNSIKWDEEDADDFCELIREMKRIKKKLEVENETRKQWSAFLRAICKPFFNQQEPEATGTFVNLFYNWMF